ncbi:PIR protein, putative [Plasmodium sp.]|nr:PIR protein, putative [Plasmodium sp.]
MKVHYINILLFALPLNILVSSPEKNSSITTHHTRKIPTTRLLCECELYEPANYDNNQEMKAVMEIFNTQAQQRFHEYDDRMKTTRQKCKDKCDKEIQKIILKDKLEKELMDKFATLETDIQSDDIPTCICEKSLAEKMEETCLKCTQNLGGIVAPSSGVLAGIAEGALYAWKTVALKAAIDKAIAAGASDISAAAEAAGQAMGVETVIAKLEALGVHKLIPEISTSFFKSNRYNDITNIVSFIHTKRYAACSGGATGKEAMCEAFDLSFGISEADSSTGLLPRVAVPQKITEIVGQANQGAAEAAEAARQTVTAKITTEQTTAINTIFMGKQAAIIASVVAIVVIVLIMVIIYLILRYRRKKRMKKKIQYIKLLKE